MRLTSIRAYVFLARPNCLRQRWFFNIDTRYMTQDMELQRELVGSQQPCVSIPWVSWSSPPQQEVAKVSFTWRLTHGPMTSRAPTKAGTADTSRGSKQVACSSFGDLHEL